MLFAADVNFISQLDSLALVKLMRALLYAECSQTGIALRAASAPLQITVPDGGEDGKAEWSGGAPSTDYFPSRVTIFQSKAQNLTETIVKNEVLKTVPAGKGPIKRVTKELNSAITEALDKKGAYVIFCSQPMTGKKRHKLAAAIKDAIREGGGDPSRLAAVEIYGANEIGAWTDSRPAVATWLASLQAGRSLAGFQTFEGWGRSPDIAKVPWSASGAPRFVPVNRDVSVAERVDKDKPAWTFDQALSGMHAHLGDPQNVVRVFGPSGFGKSRFAYQCFAQGTGVAAESDRASLIYADFNAVGDELIKVALQLADARASGVLVVDDCPDHMHIKLSDIAGRTDSRLRVVTINIETKVQQAARTLALRLEKAPDELIGDIATAVEPSISDATKEFVKKLADGFPRMAVLAAQQKFERRRAIASADQVIERILWGDGSPNPEAERSLSALCLFEWVGIAGDARSEADEVANLVGVAGDAFIEHVKSFAARGIILRRGDYAQAGPIPLAARLGARRLTLMPDGRLFAFFLKAPSHLQQMLLARLRWLDTTREAQDFARAFLAPDQLGNIAALNTAFGSQCLDRVVHLAPDLAMGTIDDVFRSLSLEELRALTTGRRHLVWALEKLVFRRQTFDAAATLLRRLAAAENEGKIGNNATGIFKQLYQLYLGGTEAEPQSRLRVLDAGLSSAEPTERAVCVEALDHMLDTQHFTRGGGAEEIGSSEPLTDWQPEFTSEIAAFYRAAVERLTNIATSDDALAQAAVGHLASSIRGLVRVLPFVELKALVDRVTAKRGFWIEAARGLNAWLYFDRKSAPKKLAKEVRAYYDNLLPSDTVGLAEFFTSGWPADLHNPDRDYDRDDKSGHDFEYATRKATELAPAIAADPALLVSALSRFACGSGKSLFAFAKALVAHLVDPIAAFTTALEVAAKTDKPANRDFFAGMLSGIDARDPALARQCLRAALATDILKESAIGLIGSGRLLHEDLRLVVDLLRAGDVKPWQCSKLSYGRGLDHLTLEDFAELLDALAECGAPGLWAALEIIEMTIHGGRALEPALVSRLKSILVAPDLFKQASRQTMNAYHWKEAVQRLVRTGHLDAAFAKDVTTQVLSLCERSKSDVFHEMDSAAQEVLAALLGVQPKAVWHKITKALAQKDTIFRHRLHRLLEPDGDKYLASGVLFGLPADYYLEWTRKKPAKRASQVVEWLPAAVKGPDGRLTWHPTMEEFVNEFGSVENVLGALARRLYPRSWWGSLAHVLEPHVALLQTWLDHANADVRAWARARISVLQTDIIAATKRSEEDMVRYG